MCRPNMNVYYVNDSPYWLRNMFSSINGFGEMEVELKRFNGRFSGSGIVFDSEHDYLLCVLRWS